MASKDLIKRLGGFLTDLSEDRPPARIHSDLSVWSADPQMGEAYRDVKDFVTVWTALRHGLALPEQSWIRLVLPTVVYYSNRDALKANMEMALHMWRSARDAPQEALPAEATVRLLPPQPLPSTPEPEPIAPVQSPKRKRWKWLLPVTAVACTAALLVFLLTRPSPGARGSAPAPAPTETFVDAPIPSMEPPPPSASPSASPIPPKPSPVPSWSSAPVINPSAPMNLRVVSKTKTSIGLAWDTPANMGSGGFLHYRVFQNGVDLGPTVYNGKTVAYLKPGTSYLFHIKAYNKAGGESPASNPVTATTDPPAPPSIFSAPDHNAIRLGIDFSINGTGMPCDSPATINVYLRQMLVATTTTNGNTFQAPIDVLEENGDFFVKWLPLNDRIQLTEDKWEAKVELPAQPQCSPMADLFLMLTFTKSG